MKIKALLTAVFLAVAVAPALYATPAAAQAQQTETLEQRLARNLLRNISSHGHPRPVPADARTSAGCGRCARGAAS
jgi:hypothetical protein